VVFLYCLCFLFVFFVTARRHRGLVPSPALLDGRPPRRPSSEEMITIGLFYFLGVLLVVERHEEVGVSFFRELTTRCCARFFRRRRDEGREGKGEARGEREGDRVPLEALDEHAFFGATIGAAEVAPGWPPAPVSSRRSGRPPMGRCPAPGGGVPSRWAPGPTPALGPHGHPTSRQAGEVRERERRVSGGGSRDEPERGTRGFLKNPEAVERVEESTTVRRRWG
jgi:hypothetical protein